MTEHREPPVTSLVPSRLVTSAISRDPEIMSGTPAFPNTRVPIATLFEYLADDAPLSEFLYDFPGVSREAALAVLALAKRALASDEDALYVLEDSD